SWDRDRGIPDLVKVGHGDAPMGHRALGVAGGYVAKSLLRWRIAKECSSATPRLKPSCTAASHDTGKETLPSTSSRTPEAGCCWWASWVMVLTGTMRAVNIANTASVDRPTTVE